MSSFRTSSPGSCFLPFMNGGMFKLTSGFNQSCIVNPRSAIFETPGLVFNVSRKADTQVSSTSDLDLACRGDTYEMFPLGVQATRNFAVL